jgi:hypothetical protein
MFSNVFIREAAYITNTLSFDVCACALGATKHWSGLDIKINKIIAMLKIATYRQSVCLIYNLKDLNGKCVLLHKDYLWQYGIQMEKHQVQ